MNNIGEQRELKIKSRDEKKSRKDFTVYGLVTANQKKPVFKGDLDQDDPIDDMEEGFVNVAEVEISDKKLSYYGNIITLVPASYKNEGVANFVEDSGTDPSLKGKIYIGTSMLPGGCTIDQLSSVGESRLSTVGNLLLEKGADGQPIWTAFHLVHANYKTLTSFDLQMFINVYNFLRKSYLTMVNPRKKIKNWPSSGNHFLP